MHLASWLMLVTIVALPSSVSAAERRVALLVGHPLGGTRLTPLRYVENDLERMRDVLTQLGGFAPDDVVVSYREDTARVTKRFAEARAALASTTPGESALFLFYFSGHAQDGSLRLGEGTLPLVRIKELVEQTGAGLRVALLDACRTGGITRLKGATKQEPVVLDVDDERAQNGQVLIAASSEDEDAQESDAIQGSFFTHFLASGLRGAADDNADGRVTLSEAYAFAYANTVAGTVGTSGGIQHPTYRFDLRGTGDVVLSRLDAPASGIRFPAQVSGEFVVFNKDKSLIVAEFLKGSDRGAFLALGPGRYVVKKRESDHLRTQDLEVRSKGTTLFDPSRTRRVELGDDRAKGRVVSADEILHGRLGVELSLAAGPQTFLSAPARAGYFPSFAVTQLRLDLHNLVRRHLGLRFDLGLGSSGPSALVVRDPYLGEIRHRVQVGSLTSGMALAGLWPLGRTVAAGLHARLGVLMVTRNFVDSGLPSQHFSTLTPGVGGEISVGLFDWLRLGLHGRAHYMFFNVDESMSLLFVDGGIFVSTVLR